MPLGESGRLARAWGRTSSSPSRSPMRMGRRGSTWTPVRAGEAGHREGHDRL